MDFGAPDAGSFRQMILDQADHVWVTDAFALGCYAMWFDTDEDVWVFI